MLLSNLNLMATAPGGVARLRELILTLAVQGKLVPQDPKDEPASELLKKIRAEKDQLIAEGKIKRDKPLAEIAEEEKPFELPSRWAWVRMGEVCDGGSGTTPLRARADFFADGTEMWVKTTDLTNGLVTTCEELITKAAVVENRLKYFPAGTVCVAMYGGAGTIGKSGVLGVSSTINQSVFALPPTKCIDSGFLHTYVISVRSQWMSFAAGLRKDPNINGQIIKRMVMPLPPLAEQSRIVTRVEELMRLCDALEAKGQLEATQHAQLVSTLLATLTDSETSAQLADNWHRIATHFDLLLDRPEAVDALEQTILQLAVRGLLVPQDPQDEPASELLKKIRVEKDKLIAEGKIKRDKALPPIVEAMYPCDLPEGWAWMRFSELGNFCGGKTPSTQRSRYWDGDIPWITPKDMKQLLLSDSEDKVTRAALDDGLALIPLRSVLIVVRSGILRRTLPTAINLVETTINQDLKALVLVRPELADYVQLLIQGFEGFILANLTKIGTTVESMQFETFAAQPFPLPPLAEQSRIVTRVAQLLGLCADLRQRLAASQRTQAHLAEALVQEVV